MFRSFYLAGFECATGYNMHGEWIDQIAATEHDLHVDADYARLDDAGMHGRCYFTPMNEPSYFSWAGGEVGRFAPHATGRGHELKLALARAAIAGIAAIRDACPQS